MHSSTSSSDPVPPPGVNGRTKRPTMRYAVLLIAGSLLVLFGAEIVTVFLLPRTSQIERRSERELAAASKLQANDSILLVGNSLLGTGVDMKVLKDRLDPEKDAHRLYIENTGYFDWKYGLRSLFDAGSRPGTVVVVLSVPQLLSNSFRGDYTIHRLVRWQDIPRVAREIECDRTQASGFYLAKASRFYSSRAEIRSWLLGRLIPQFGDLRRDLAPRATPGPADSVALEKLHRRLEDLAAVADDAGVRLLVVVPPTLGATSREDLVRRVEKGTVPIFLPLSSDQTMEADYEPDAYHLNPVGAVKFSEALATVLK